MNTSNIRDQVRLRAVSHSSGTSSSCWLKAISQPSLDLAFSALRVWLGILLFPLLPLWTCLAVTDQFGDHLLGCSHGPLRIQCHDALVTVVYHAYSKTSCLLQAGVAAAGGVTSDGGDFIPLVFKSFCVWSPFALSTLFTIADRTTVKNDPSRKLAWRQLLQRLSMTSWKYNAKMVLRYYALVRSTCIIYFD